MERNAKHLGTTVLHWPLRKEKREKRNPPLRRFALTGLAANTQVPYRAALRDCRTIVPIVQHHLEPTLEKGTVDPQPASFADSFEMLNSWDNCSTKGSTYGIRETVDSQD